MCFSALQGLTCWLWDWFCRDPHGHSRTHRAIHLLNRCLQPLCSGFHMPPRGSLEWDLQVHLTYPREAVCPCHMQATQSLPSSPYRLPPSYFSRRRAMSALSHVYPSTLGHGLDPLELPASAARTSQASVQRVSCLSPDLACSPQAPLEPNSDPTSSKPLLPLTPYY